MYLIPPPKSADEVIGGCIAIWKNAWTNPLKTITNIENAIKENEQLQWHKALTNSEENQIGEVNTNYRTNLMLWLKESAMKSEPLRNISNAFFDLTASCANWYTKEFGIEEMVYINEEFNLLKYETGQEYHAHYDGGSQSKRVISPILYLNNDYEGGELEFVNFNIKIKPEPGMFLIFPANYAYRHIAHPVKKGTKYAIVTWLHDLA